MWKPSTVHTAPSPAIQSSATTTIDAQVYEMTYLPGFQYHEYAELGVDAGNHNDEYLEPMNLHLNLRDQPDEYLEPVNRRNQHANSSARNYVYEDVQVCV